MTMKASYSIESSSLLSYVTWAPRYIDLFSLVYKAINALKQLNVRLDIVHFDLDEFVCPKSLNVFKTHVQACLYDVTILPASGHFLYEKEDKEKLLLVFNKFVRTKKSNDKD